MIVTRRYQFFMAKREPGRLRFAISSCAYIDVRTNATVSAAQAEQNAREKWAKEYPDRMLAGVLEIPVGKSKPNFSIGPRR